MTDHHTHGPGCPCPPTAVVSSGPDIPDEAVEAARDELYRLLAFGGWKAADLQVISRAIPSLLVAAYPALTRHAVAADRVRWLNVTDAVAAEREHIATAIEAAKTGHEYDDDIRDDDARIARTGGTP